MRYIRLASCSLRLLILGALFGIGAAYAAPFAYISNSSDDNVSVIDTATNTVVATVPVGSFPIAVAVNAAGTFAYVANAFDNTVSVIDTATNTVVATPTVGNVPQGVAVNPAGTFAYVANTGGDNVSVINTATNLVVATVAVGSFPIGVAVNPAGTFAYVVNFGSVGTVSVIDTATNTVATTVTVGLGPAGVAFNPAGTFAYVTNYDADTVSVINTATHTVAATVPVGDSPYGVAVTPAGTFAYVANNGGTTVSVINTATNTVAASVTVGTSPVGVAVNPAGTFAYVANQSSDNVSVINTATNAVVATVPVGTDPQAFGSFIGTPPAVSLLSALSPAKVWVGLKNSDDVGLRLDLLAEVFINATAVGQGQLNNVGGGGSGFNNALLSTIPLTLTGGSVSAPAGAQLSIKVSARRTCVGAGHNSGSARLWYNGQPFDTGASRDAGTRFGATIGGTTSDYFLRSGAGLSATAGVSRTSADVFVTNAALCPARPFTTFGTWSRTLP